MKAAAGIFLSALLASGQQPAAPLPDSGQPGAVFTVTATLVQVAAVVTDSGGRHITGLKREDFQLFQDGARQNLTHFSYLEVAPAPPAPKLVVAGDRLSPKTLPASPPPPETPLRKQDVRRTLVMMVDDLGLSFKSMAFVRKSLRTFVDQQMQPGDLVAICRTGAGSGALQQFSADKRVLLSVIDGLRWNPNGRFGVTYFDPYGKAPSWENLLGSLPSGASGPDDPLYDARSNAIAAYGTLGAMNYIIGALRDMPGRKSLVLFSDGLQIFEAGAGPRIHRTSAQAARNAPDSYAGIMRVLRLLIDRANRSGTAIYTIAATGAQTLQPDAEAGVESPRTQARATDAGLTQQPRAAAESGEESGNNVLSANLAYLAGETGGLAYENGNDLNWGLQRVLDDQAGYYLLGYRPAGDSWQGKDGSTGFHHIQVKVTRAGLHVRSQSGFFGQTDSETLPRFSTPIEQLRATMLSPFQSSDVGLRLTALYAEVPKRGPVVRNLLRVDAAGLSWRRDEDGSSHARVLLVVVATGASDRPLVALGRNYNIAVAPERMHEVLRDGVLCALDVPVPQPGAYQVRVAVRDEATARIGSATQFLEIPDLKKARLALASVVLRDGGRSLAPGRPDITPALRQFRRGGSIEFLCTLEQGRKKTPGAGIETKVRVWRDDREVYTAPARLIETQGGGRAVFGTLSLGGDITLGDYDLQVIAVDRSAGKVFAARQWTDFTVLP